MAKIINKIKRISLALIVPLIISVFSGCTNNNSNKDEIVFGTTLSVNSLDPAKDYNGWYTVRYGICETLFVLDDEMKVSMNLALGYENINDNTWKIKIRNDVNFQNGEKMTLEKVKSSLERALEVNDRASDTLKIENIDIKDDSLIITTKEKNPTLINDLCDPFASIVNVESTEDFDNNPIGTGPFIVNEFAPTKYSTFVKNENYYKGEVKTDKIKVIQVSDADTLTMAMQTGEIDIAQGIPYSSMKLFEKSPEYKIESTETSRAIVLYYNFGNEVICDDNIRKAINYSINKEDYASVLLNGSASKAVGPVPNGISDIISDEDYDLEKAKEILKEAGYIDTDNDGILEKDGKKASFKLITYTSRSELPIIAQSIQDDLKKIGIEVSIEITDNIMEKLKGSQFDLALYSNITMATGDVSPYLNNLLKTNGASNYGKFTNEDIDDKLQKLNVEFDLNKRKEMSEEIIQEALDIDGMNFISHIKMNFVMKSNINNFKPHPTDYYQFNYLTEKE